MAPGRHSKVSSPAGGASNRSSLTGAPELCSPFSLQGCPILSYLVVVLSTSSQSVGDSLDSREREEDGLAQEVRHAWAQRSVSM